MSCTIDGRITSVQPGSPAAYAGIHPGDQIDLRATAFESRRVILYDCETLRRATYHLVIAHGASRRTVDLATVAEDLRTWSRVGLLLRTAAAIVAVATAGLLVLLRPSLMTWSFFLFAAGANPGSHGGFVSSLPYAAAAIEALLESLALTAGCVGVMVFLILFPTVAPTSKWTTFMLGAAPWLMILGFAVVIYGYVAQRLYLPVYEVQRDDAVLFSLALPLIGLAAFFERYVRAVGTERARIRWVGAALAVALSGYIAALILENWTPGRVPYVVLSFLYSTLMAVPFAVLYAVLKHHVIDVKFFISRAIAYTFLTGLIVVGFSVVDWFFSKKLAAASVGTGIDVTLAIGLGFFLNGLHHRAGLFVDRVFFRQRREAETRLERAARSIAHASTPEAVQRLLVKVPYNALQLESAALFHRGPDGRFRGEYALGSQKATLANMGADDDLVLHLAADREPRRLSEITWDCEDLADGDSAPVIAFPVFVRQELEAFVLFGSHRNGADIDPDEERLLRQLAANAGAAYDHIDAMNVRAEMETMRLKLAALSP